MKYQGSKKYAARIYSIFSLGKATLSDGGA
jgi:hypothetical protein